MPTQHWIDHAYPLQQLVIKLQGTQDSDKSDVIQQIETVLLRLKAGDESGLAYDKDDFGYSFEYFDASPGPSFFDDQELPSQHWINHSYPLQQILIQLQGTRHSDRSDIIHQLETVLLKLKAGEVTGQAHDDDFGYCFEYFAASLGPSIFDTLPDQH